MATTPRLSDTVIDRAPWWRERLLGCRIWTDTEAGSAKKVLQNHPLPAFEPLQPVRPSAPPPRAPQGTSSRPPPLACAMVLENSQASVFRQAVRRAERRAWLRAKAPLFALAAAATVLLSSGVALAVTW